jgi:hypothetical protein
LPSTWRTCAPWIIAWESFPNAIFPSGNRTNALIPARAAYAAAEADVFPVDAQMTESEPSAFALDTAIVIPRSLKEPVGFSPSYFRYSSVPGAIRRASVGAGMRGVFPSNSVTIASSGTKVKNRP